MDGKLITVEGIDGSGKTTLINGLEDRFESVTITTEPNDDTWLGESVRRAISTDETHPMSVFFLFLSDHANHVDSVIKPALRNGDVVISDRYIDSRYAYQQEAIDDLVPGDTFEWIRGIQESGNWSRLPDYTILIDIPAEVAMERLEEDRETFEKLDFLQTVRKNYLDLAKEYNDRYIVLDGTQSSQKVLEECTEELNSLEIS